MEATRFQDHGSKIILNMHKYMKKEIIYLVNIKILYFIKMTQVLNMKKISIEVSQN